MLVAMTPTVFLIMSIVSWEGWPIICEGGGRRKAASRPCPPGVEAGRARPQSSSRTAARTSLQCAQPSRSHRRARGSWRIQETATWIRSRKGIN
jgi:hypothetical protein